MSVADHCCLEKMLMIMKIPCVQMMMSLMMMNCATVLDSHHSQYYSGSSLIFLFVCKFSSVNFGMVDRRRRRKKPLLVFKKLHLET
jgi:hypothetical protein